MRQPQNGKTDRENISLTIGKKKNVRGRKRAWNRRSSRVTMENLECINDALRFHQAYGIHGAWKLVPKDSCEVYKDQRKRQDNPKTNKDRSNGRVNGKRPVPGRKGGRKDQSDHDDSLSDESRYSKDRPTRNTKKTKRNTKRKRKAKSPKRPASDDSVTSYTTYSETTMSSAPSSDMDE